MSQSIQVGHILLEPAYLYISNDSKACDKKDISIPPENVRKPLVMVLNLKLSIQLQNFESKF